LLHLLAKLPVVPLLLLLQHLPLPHQPLTQPLQQKPKSTKNIKNRLMLPLRHQPAHQLQHQLASN
jgi:hypothetical protein